MNMPKKSKKKDVERRIEEVGIIPVLRAESAQAAVAAAKAICDGGIPILEITMTIPDAPQVIAELTLELSRKILIGAGTVMDAQTAKACANAGAQFIVSPSFDAATVEAMQREGVVMMAGALTPTEVITAWRAGSDFVKVFPCGNVGGPSYIRALKTVFPKIPMIPTGGVNLKNAAEFLRAGASAVGVGSELILPDALAAGDLEAIRASAQRFATVMREEQMRRHQPRVA
jgi:2-dehydro-3-deoxyphosphogluconate aldolase/(4S)-4-hydroxy-2-oxoglutarate aldolase